MKCTALALLIAAGCFPLLAQTPSTEGNAPVVTTFIAPAYPRLAAAARLQGRTVSRITVAKDGSVLKAETISGHPVFAAYAINALKGWRFKPNSEVWTFEVTIRFEFIDDCDKPAETKVSADLPYHVLVQTSSTCIEISVS
jgi:TonB family protein